MILDDILEKRRLRLENEKKALPFEVLQAQVEILPPVRNFYKALKAPGISVIAEVKKASPSKGLIRPDFQPAAIAKAYEANGAACISCLTEEDFFLGSSQYLKEIRKVSALPILRKDFIFDPYQIYEARAIGADAILLIVAMLSKDMLSLLKGVAHSLGLHCLVEVHNEAELESALTIGANIIGINNRDLKTFEVSLDISKALAGEIPADVIRISESGITSPADVTTLSEYGMDGILVGEMLMRQPDPGKALRSLLGKEGSYEA